MARRLVGFLFAPMILAAVTCGGESDPPGSSCVQGLQSDCAPLYEPTYANVFQRTLRPTCASGTGSCHTKDAGKGGLVFADADEAYEMLLGTNGGKKRVLAGDAACSLIMQRLEATEPSVRMPPGTSPLLAAERCAIQRWIQNGAPR